MVKLVVGEEAQLKQLEDRLLESAILAQVGIVIGKLLPDLARGFIYNLIPTPVTDTGLPACSLSPDSGGVDQTSKKKKNSKESSGSDYTSRSLVIDTEWVAEHARQVSRMLLGGMHVVGIYVGASDNSFKQSLPMLCQLVKVVAKASLHPGVALEKMLLIHLSYSPRRWTCRNFLLKSNSISTGLQLCDLKMGKLLSSIQHFECTHNFEIRLPIHESNINSCTFKAGLHTAINILVEQLKTAEALIDGNLVTEDLVSTLGEVHKVEFLLPFGNELHLEVCRMDKVIGFIIFHGAVSAHAYLGSKTPIYQVISDIKDDIIASLWSRLDIMSEDFERDIETIVEENKNASNKILDRQLTLDELKKCCNLLFPKRVLVPWVPGVFICDYIKTSETFEDLKCHCEEVLSMDALDNLRSILEVEKDAQASGCTFCTEAPGSSTAIVGRLKNGNSSVRNKRSIDDKFKFLMLIAIALVVLSVFVKLMY